MAKNESLDLKRPAARRVRRPRGANVPATHLGWKPHFLRTQELTLHEPRVVPVYWDPHFQKVPADVAIFDEFLRTLFRSSWMTALCDYGVAPARLLPSFVAKDAPCASLSQGQLEDQLIEWLATEAVMPRPSKTERSLIYLVLTPLATKLTLGSLSSPKDFSGYHDCTAFDRNSDVDAQRVKAKNLFYVAVPLTATGPEILDAHSVAISRELAEAFIDRSHWLGDLGRATTSKRRALRAQL
jgi:hypothetical protein